MHSWKQTHQWTMLSIRTFFHGKNLVLNHSLCSYHVTSSCQVRQWFEVVENANPKRIKSLLDPGYEGLENTKKMTWRCILKVDDTFDSWMVIAPKCLKVRRWSWWPCTILCFIYEKWTRSQKYYVFVLEPLSIYYGFINLCAPVVISPTILVWITLLLYGP